LGDLVGRAQGVHSDEITAATVKPDEITAAQPKREKKIPSASFGRQQLEGAPKPHLFYY